MRRQAEGTDEAGEAGEAKGLDHRRICVSLLGISFLMAEAMKNQ